MSEVESGAAVAQEGAAVARSHPDGGLVIEGFSFANIVRLRDGGLVTEGGMGSADNGRSWRRREGFKAPGGIGLLRMPNGDLGTYRADRWDMVTALGNASNNWHFCRSSDEGASWSAPVKITIDGLTQGLAGTMFNLADGKRTLLFTYSQFLGSRFDKRGASWGTLKGVRFQTETEGHFPLAEVARAYYSDDSGRTWQACDGWIMGWREGGKWTDAFTEPDAVELGDGRIYCIGRTLTGRLYRAVSEDRGHSWWPGAQPMPLMAPYSPGRILRLPKTGDLLVVWNQHSREEIRKGFRRSRLSCAVSKDEGETWEHFRNLEAITSLAGVSRVPTEEDLTPVVGDDEVGELPEDYANFHYPAVAAVGNEVFIYYGWNRYAVGKGEDGEPTVVHPGGSRTRVLPVEWFYEKP
ncbi:MAG: sialidase family protein [Planctomycetota bacterium]